jgi:hypothetical protein
MTLVFNPFAAEGLLIVNLAGGGPIPLAVGLWTTAHAPAYADTLATYAALELAAGGGYARIGLSFGSWFFATVSPQGLAQYTGLVWTFTGARSVAGYFVCDAANTLLYWAESFSGGPYVLGGGGGPFGLTLNLSAQSP